MKLELFINFLNSIAYYYYPKKLHETSSFYASSEEHKRYLELREKWGYYKNNLNPVIQKIQVETNGNNLIINGTTNSIPCFEIEMLQESNEEKIIVVVVYISMFIPFYHIACLEKSKSENRIKVEFDISKNVELMISKILHEFLNYHKFPIELLNYQIPGLEVYSDFDYIKAFFTDCYRVAHI